MEKDSIDADEFFEIVASNPETLEDFVGMENTPETREKLYQFIKKKFREQIIADFIGVQPLSAPAGLILTMRARYTNGSET